MGEEAKEAERVEEPQLTEAERITVETTRHVVVYTAYQREMVALLAIIDRLAPKPEPVYKPCPWNCGSKPPQIWRLTGDKKLYRVSCDCGYSGPYRPTDIEAWAAWHRRA